MTLANSNCRPDFVDSCELVVVSPLTRALQTFEIGLKPHFASDGDLPEVIALPEAAERLYLISDVGRPVSELQKSFRYVDFETGFAGKHDRNKWWYQPGSNYSEWRPVNKGQRYAYYGEPDADFDLRMSRLHSWLDQRPEKSIAVVCHHGVIDWLLDMNFDNCQYQQVAFHSIRPKSLLP
jgi:broad specificity phosphatase PhoE